MERPAGHGEEACAHHRSLAGKPVTAAIESAVAASRFDAVQRDPAMKILGATDLLPKSESAIDRAGMSQIASMPICPSCTSSCSWNRRGCPKRTCSKPDSN